MHYLMYEQPTRQLFENPVNPANSDSDNCIRLLILPLIRVIPKIRDSVLYVFGCYSENPVNSANSDSDNFLVGCFSPPLSFQGGAGGGWLFILPVHPCHPKIRDSNPDCNPLIKHHIQHHRKQHHHYAHQLY